MLDFLYSDHERVAALMSQIEGIGSLVGLERTYNKENKAEAEISGSLKVVSGKRSSSQNANKQLRQEFDPLWMNSIKLVESVKERATERGQLDYGKILTVAGRLMCIDQGIFNNLLKSPSVINQIAPGINVDGNRSSKVQQKERRDIADIVREFVQSLPLGIIFILFTEADAYWFNVKREYLQLQSLDIPLKFPIQFGGTWHVTGIVDAMPQDYAELANELGNFDDRFVAPKAISIIAPLVVPLVGTFGRPSDAYGLSPLTIHREIAF